MEEKDGEERKRGKEAVEGEKTGRKRGQQLKLRYGFSIDGLTGGLLIGGRGERGTEVRLGGRADMTDVWPPHRRIAKRGSRGERVRWESADEIYGPQKR